MEYLGADKVRNFKALTTIWSAADALDLCIFAIAPTRVLTLEDMASLLAAVTGWSTSSFEIMQFGKRRLDLMRVYNLREGLTAADDTLPERFFTEPVGIGRWAQTHLDRQRFAGEHPHLLPHDGLGRSGPPRLRDARRWTFGVGGPGRPYRLD